MLGRPRLGRAGGLAIAPAITRSAATASPASACPTSPRASRRPTSSRWPIARSIRRPSIRPRSGTTCASTRRASTRASAGFEADVGRRCRLLFRAGNPARQGKPALTAFVRENGGWFGPLNTAPDLPRDERVIDRRGRARLRRSARAQRLLRPGQLVHERRRATSPMRNGRGRTGGGSTCRCCSCTRAYDYVCETIDSRLAEPMRAHCAEPDRGDRPLGTLDGAGDSRPSSTPRWRAGWPKSGPTFGSKAKQPTSARGRAIMDENHGPAARHQFLRAIFMADFFSHPNTNSPMKARFD